MTVPERGASTYLIGVSKSGIAVGYHPLPTPEVAIDRMIKAVWPGGWLLIEKVDFFPVHALSNADDSADQ